MSTSSRLFETLSLPEGETLIWQGRPSARGLALRVFHMRLIALYFVGLVLLRLIISASAGQPWREAMVGASHLAIPLVVVMILLGGLSILYSRTTRYTVTNRRVLIQFGAALPMTFNIPFRQVASAAIKEYADGSGELPLVVSGGDGPSFLLLWPHVRPWRLSNVEPMLRCVPEARRLADLLAGALAAAAPRAPEPVAAAMTMPTPPAATRAVASAA